MSCSTSLELYALSRQKFCRFFWLWFDLDDEDDDMYDHDLLITVLSRALITTVAMRVFADVIIVESPLLHDSLLLTHLATISVISGEKLEELQ